MKNKIRNLCVIAALTLFTISAFAYEEDDQRETVIYKLKTGSASVLPAEPGTFRLNGYKSWRLHPENELSAENISEESRWYYSSFKSGAKARKALVEIQKRNDIEYAYLLPRAYPAGFQSGTMAATEAVQFEQDQKYLLSAPVGFDAIYAWGRKGGNGAGVTLVDIEGDWNKRHSDLKLRKIKIRGTRAGKDSSWYHHGTAVAGIINGRKNSYGVSGIAWKSKLKLSSIFRKAEGGGLFSNVSDTIYSAAKRLKAGDIILIEVQFGGLVNAGEYIPVEYYQDCFEAIQYATSKGIIVVEAAGNGGQNLDHAMYEDLFDPGIRGDSGAILVGAGGAPKTAYPYKTRTNDNRTKLWFSNYGKRVDVQNWGEYVVSTGYGNLLNDGPRATYTGSFSGTSSASALTAGLCASLQGVAKELLGRPLTPGEMRQVLRETGDSQRGDSSDGNIGSRPNLKKAIEFIESGGLQ